MKSWNWRRGRSENVWLLKLIMRKVMIRWIKVFWNIWWEWWVCVISGWLGWGLAFFGGNMLIQVLGTSGRCKVATWEPLLENLRNRLNSWGNKYESRGVLCSLSWYWTSSQFFISFFKVPSKMIKRVVRIQKEFLWGGLRGASKIC